MQTCDDVRILDSTNKENKFPNENLSQVDKSLHDPPIKPIIEQVTTYFNFWIIDYFLTFIKFIQRHWTPKLISTFFLEKSITV